MEKYTQKQLRGLVASGAAIDITHEIDPRKAVPESYTQIGYASGVYGCSGMLLRGLQSGKLYAVTSRTQAIYLY